MDRKTSKHRRFRTTGIVVVVTSNSIFVQIKTNVVVGNNIASHVHMPVTHHRIVDSESIVTLTVYPNSLSNDSLMSLHHHDHHHHAVFRLVGYRSTAAMEVRTMPVLCHSHF